jgi:signal transduction histidine kinase
MATEILCEHDVATVRESVREIGLRLDFPPPDLRRAQAIASEICLHVLAIHCPAEVFVTVLRRGGRTGISLVLQTPAKITEKDIEDDSLSPGLGLAGARRLADLWEISVRNGKTTLHAAQWTPGRRPEEALADRYLQLIETTPHTAWAFGRQAVIDGLGIADMAALHAHAMKHASSADSVQHCYEEALAAFELVYRSFPEARLSMKGIHELLEQETERLAQSLHDEAAQAMAALSIGIEGIECGHEDCAGQVARLKSLVEQTDHLFRSLSHELLSPRLADEGLSSALRALCESFSSRRGIHVEYRDDLHRRLEPAFEQAFYRMVQTSLSNVVRHAGASNVLVRSFAAGSSVVCSVRDNGRGLGPAQLHSAGLGLRGIRERAAALGGTMEMQDVLPHGLEVRLCLPDKASPGN